jgi:outer membrane immunogenic protein
VAPVVAPYPVSNWSGFYIGGQLGGGWSDSFHWLLLGPSETFEHRSSSWFGGGHVGLQGQWGSWVAGIEGTYSWTGLTSTVNSRAIPGAVRTLELDSIATVVGKLGFAAANWLFYAKGGWASAHLDASATSPLVTASASGQRSGWTFGTGIDYLVTSDWIVGVDFNRYIFDFEHSATATNGTQARWFDGRTDVWAVTGRLSYKFGVPPIMARY